MANLTLSNLLELILTELASTFEQTVKPADLIKMYADNNLEVPEELLNLHVSDLDIDLPAHLQVQIDPLSPTKATRFTIAVPSTLETPPPGRLGRIRITIKSEIVKNV